MFKMRLSKRLQILLDTVEPCQVLADIGCDHGYLSVGAVLANKAEKVIAADISIFCVKKADDLAKKYGIEEKMLCIQSDGFAEIFENVDVAVIAGMGGRETVKILENAKVKADTYILSPHQEIVILRKYLRDNGFFIEKDFTVFDGKFYEIIKAKKSGTSNYTDSEIYIGKNLPESDGFSARLKSREIILSEAIEKSRGNVAADIMSEWEAIKNYDKNL